MTPREYYLSEDPQYAAGTLVRVNDKLSSRSSGWDNGWVASMDRAVGHVYEIYYRSSGTQGYSLRLQEDNPYESPGINTYYFPHYVLKPVEIETHPEVEINNLMIL